MTIDKPYIIIPKLINQPTWGGTYILKTKKWTSKPFAAHVKIGQSYELFSGTKLFTAGNSTEHELYTGEIGYPDHPGTDEQYFSLTCPNGYITLHDLINENPVAILGEKVVSQYGIMPLLIKINHAKGNSYQLHIRPQDSHPHWKPKAESWYYLEDGLLTYGVKKDVSIAEYKKTCLSVDAFMKALQKPIQEKLYSYDKATFKVQEFIRQHNPINFVNVIHAKKYDLVDLSGGGLHHSWEQDDVHYPMGNIIYEIQQDVMDPVSTIRAFDQGKLKKDGSVRTIAIEDYFHLLDTDPIHNDIVSARRSMHGTNALITKHYVMDVVDISSTYRGNTKGSFVHIFVRDGTLKVATNSGEVLLGQSTSCFVPSASRSYILSPTTSHSVALISYIPVFDQYK